MLYNSKCTIKAATVKSTGEQVSYLTFPYQEQIVDRFHDDDLKGVTWKKERSAWRVPAAYKEAVYAIVRRFYAIDGEESQVEWKVVKMHIKFHQDKRHSNRKAILIDGCDVLNPDHGNTIKYSSEFDILEERGGFTHGEEYNSYFDVEYDLTIQVRKNAIIKAMCGEFGIIPDPDPEPAPESDVQPDLTTPDAAEQSADPKEKNVTTAFDAFISSRELFLHACIRATVTAPKRWYVILSPTGSFCTVSEARLHPRINDLRSGTKVLAIPTLGDDNQNDMDDVYWTPIFEESKEKLIKDLRSQFEAN